MAKKKKKLEALSEEGIWHEFELTNEHLKHRHATIVITLDRMTGEVEIDGAMSTPMETWGALDSALALACLRVQVAED